MPSAYKSLPLRSHVGTDQLFTVAAPVLAGFSLTLLGVLISPTSPDLVRWRDVAILLITVAAVLYLGSIRYAIRGSDLRITREDANATWHTRTKQATGFEAYTATHDRLIDVSRLLFAVGTITLGAGLTVLLVPNQPLGQISVARLLAIVGAGLSTLGQTIQMVARRADIRFVPSWLGAVLTPEAKLLRILRENDLLSVKDKTTGRTS
jgi:hypothetical protein